MDTVKVKVQKQKRSTEELIAAAKARDAKMDRSRKTPTKEQKAEKLIDQMVNYENIKQEVKSKESEKSVVKKEDEWDVKIGDTVEYFDPTLSYELTGYRPITKDRGLDFDPLLFTQAAQSYRRNGRYTQLIPGTFKHRNHWIEEFRRCKDGYTVGKYRITGEHYFFLNYYRLLSVLGDGLGGEVRNEDFPAFMAKQYEMFHYLELARKTGHDALIFKCRGIGFSEAVASVLANGYTFHKSSKSIVSAYAQGYVDSTLAKTWQELDFLNTCTEGGFRRVRMKIDTAMKKRASKVDTDKNETGWMSEIEGVVTDNPRKLRGARVYNLCIDEAGSFPGLVDTYIQARALVDILGFRVGMRLLGGCVCAGTKVWGGDGNLKKIEDIVLGDTMMGFNGTSSNIEPVTYLQPESYKECVEITTSFGKLECSTDHPLMVVVNGEYVTFKRASELILGDQIILKGNDLFGTIQEDEAYNIGYTNGFKYNPWNLNKDSLYQFLLGYIQKVKNEELDPHKRIILKIEDKEEREKLLQLLLKFDILSYIKGKQVYISDSEFNSYYKLPFKLSDNEKGKYFEGKTLEIIRTCNVKKIKEIGVKRIYNLTANNTHTYLTSGYISSNTGGDAGVGLEGLHKMYFNPEEYQILPYKNNYSNTGQTMFTGFFIPSYTMWFGTKECKGFDSRGVVDEERAKQYYLDKWAKIKDPHVLIKDRAEYCFTPEDAFVLEGENRFDQDLLVEQYNALTIHKSVPGPTPARLSWLRTDDEGKIDKESRPKIEFVSDSPLKILELPKLDETGHPFKNLYLIGIDGIDSDSTTSTGLTDVSKYCIIVYRRAFGIEPPKVVATYLERPLHIQTAFEMTLKLCQFYNAQALFEASRVSVKHYFEKEHMLHYLMRRPSETSNRSSRTNLKQYGVPAATHIIDHQLDLIELYIVDYSTEIQFPELLDELIRYSYANKRKFDMVAAFGIAMLADESMLGKTARVVNNSPDNQINLTFYKNQYGQVEFGIRPQGNRIENQTNDQWALWR